MPEGLKNAGCTFSRIIAIVLHPQLRRNILAYVDDIVVKSVQRKTTSAIWQKLSRTSEQRISNWTLKMHLQHSQGKRSGMSYFDKRRRSKSWQNQDSSWNARSCFSERRAKKMTGRVATLNSSSPELQREACLSSKFSEVQRTFSGPNLRKKLSKNSKTICQTWLSYALQSQNRHFCCTCLLQIQQWALC
jgi:hypothetical protein